MADVKVHSAQSTPTQPSNVERLKKKTEYAGPYRLLETIGTYDAPLFPSPFFLIYFLLLLLFLLYIIDDIVPVAAL